MDTAEPPQLKAALHNLFAGVVRSVLSLSSTTPDQPEPQIKLTLLSRCCTSNTVTLVRHCLRDRRQFSHWYFPHTSKVHQPSLNLLDTSKFSHCFKCSKVLLLPHFRTTAVQGRAFFEANPQVVLFPASSEQFMHGCEHLWFGEDYRIR